MSQSNDQLDLARDQHKASENEYREIVARKEGQIKDLDKALIEKQTQIIGLHKTQST